MAFGPIPLPTPPIPLGLYTIPPPPPQLLPAPQTIHHRASRSSQTCVSAISAELQEQRNESIRTLSLGPITDPDDIVHIVVESGGLPFPYTVHRGLLCHFSPYFQDYFAEENKTGPFVKPLKVKGFNYNNELNFDVPESEQPAEDSEIEVQVRIKLPPLRNFKKLYLPADLGPVKPATFAALLEWLYCAFPGQPFPSSSSHITAPTLIELWVLASRLKIPACQNDCVLGIERIRKATNVVETGMLEWVYNNTEEFERGQCGLKNLLVDQCAWILDEKWLLGMEAGKVNEAMFPRECLLDLVARMRVLLREGSWIGDMKPLEMMDERKEGAYWVQEAGDASASSATFASTSATFASTSAL